MKPKILVLDDQIQYLRSLARALRTDYDLILTSRLDQAKASLSKEIAVVLSDIRLDESRDDNRQGLEFLRYLRVDYENLPVIAMSALEEPDIEKNALAAGASRFLRKPILISQLRRVIEEFKPSDHK